MVNLAAIISFTATAVSNFGITTNNLHIPAVPMDLPAIDLPIFGTTSVDTITKTIPSEFLDSPMELVYDRIPVECTEDDNFFCHVTLTFNTFKIKSMTKLQSVQEAITETYEESLDEDIQRNINSIYNTLKTRFHIPLFRRNLKPVLHSVPIIKSTTLSCYFKASPEKRFQAATCEFLSSVLNRGVFPAYVFPIPFSNKEPCLEESMLRSGRSTADRSYSVRSTSRHRGCKLTTVNPREERNLILNISRGYWRGIRDYCYAFLALIAQKLVFILIFASMIKLLLVEIVFWLSMRVGYIQNLDKQCSRACYYQTRVRSIVLFYIQIIGHALVQVKYQYNRMAWEGKIRNFGEKFSGFFRYQTTYSNNGNGTGRRDNMIIGQLNTEWENFHLFIIEAMEKIPRNGFVFIDVVQYLSVNLPSDPYFDEWRSYHESNINMDVCYLSIKHQLLQTFCGDRVSQLNNAQQQVCRNMSIVLNYMFHQLELYYEQKGQNIATMTLKFDSVDVVLASWITLREWKEFKSHVDFLYEKMENREHYIFGYAAGSLIMHLPSDTYFDNWRQYHIKKIGVNVRFSSVKRQALTTFHPDKTKHHFTEERQEICNKLFKILNNIYDEEESDSQQKNEDMNTWNFPFLSIDTLSSLHAEAA